MDDMPRAMGYQLKSEGLSNAHDLRPVMALFRNLFSVGSSLLVAQRV
jgi:hypothetical protein